MSSNTGTLSEWVDQYTGDLFSWAVHKISDPETAKDLVQDTFLAAAEKIGSFKGDSSPKTWLFSILNHKITDTYRKKVKQPVRTDNHIFSELFDEEGNWKKEKRPGNWHEEEEHLLDNHEFLTVLAQCLEALPETWNTCVKLKYLSEKKGEEICQEAGLTPSNYWQIIHRAKLQLRECIEENWFHE
ncbi:MAG: sigma-70 family RNA polymerase sigma factor [Chlorobi bacterium]|nr:sigma-70 family RNA polymerase sigma factor [Chlorobiota bacterium]